MNTLSTVDFFDSFYPKEYLEITDIENMETQIKIRFKSLAHFCCCQKCGHPLIKKHGTYTRKVQDLPIIGKNVNLEISVRDYKCTNPDCDAHSSAEDFDGFLSYYSRMTNRCEEFICTLALNTSCEGAANICREMGIKTSGDSIIRLLEKKYEPQPLPDCGDIIGVDDFAFKKRQTYGTIIVDEKTHQPLAILDGRDGKSLKEWLQNNKHIKTVTRDRASDYAKVISEELPDAMQVADRFHLHQNLLEAVNKALGREIPATIAVPQKQQETNTPESIKKNATQCGELLRKRKKRLQLINQIQELHSQGVGISEIARRVGKDWCTVKKYAESDPDNLCRSNSSGILDIYNHFIIEELNNKAHQSEIIRRLKGKGYAGSEENARIHIKKLREKYGITASKYTSGGNSNVKKKKAIAESADFDYITRKGISIICGWRLN